MRPNLADLRLPSWSRAPLHSALWRANELNVFENAPIVVLDAVPAALTHIFVPSMPRYTVAEDISQAFYVSPKTPPRAADQVNASILRISEMDHRATSYNLLGFIDDRGIIDFVELAFRIFGMNIQSVAVLFYAVLFVSSLLFYGVYRKTLAALASLACILFAQYQILPEIVLNGQLASPLALRCAPILSLVAVMHCCLYCFRKTVHPVELVALLCQAFLDHFRPAHAINRTLAGLGRRNSRRIRGPLAMAMRAGFIEGFAGTADRVPAGARFAGGRNWGIEPLPNGRISDRLSNGRSTNHTCHLA